jgi:hypothetical protein
MASTLSCLRRLWPSTHAPHPETTETTEPPGTTGGSKTTKTTKEAPLSHPAPPTDATIDIRGTATPLDPAAPNHISEHISESSCSNPDLGARAGAGASPPLLNLPPEIRHQIWAEILSGHNIHLEVEDGSLRGTECVAPDPSRCHDAPNTEGCQAARDLERSQETNPAAGGGLDLLPLLLTCKLMYAPSLSHLLCALFVSEFVAHCLSMYRYAEAVTQIYASNTFIIRNITTIHSFPPLLPTHLNTIRTLHLITGISISQGCSLPRPVNAEVINAYYHRDWEVIWRSLSSMQGLRELDVYLHPVNTAGYFYQRESLDVALTPV